MSNSKKKSITIVIIKLRRGLQWSLRYPRCVVAGRWGAKLTSTSMVCNLLANPVCIKEPLSQALIPVHLETECDVSQVRLQRKQSKPNDTLSERTGQPSRAGPAATMQGMSLTPAFGSMLGMLLPSKRLPAELSPEDALIAPGLAPKTTTAPRLARISQFDGAHHLVVTTRSVVTPFLSLLAGSACLFALSTFVVVPP